MGVITDGEYSEKKEKLLKDFIFWHARINGEARLNTDIVQSTLELQTFEVYVAMHVALRMQFLAGQLKFLTKKP